MLRGKYVATNITDDQRKKMLDAHNFPDMNIEETLSVTSAEGLKRPMPLKYLFFKEDGMLDMQPSSFAGYALNLLCKKDSRLNDALIHGRNSVEGLRDIAKILNEKSPDLYPRLQRIGTTEADFTEGLNYVITDIIGGTNNSVHVNGGLKDAEVK